MTKTAELMEEAIEISMEMIQENLDLKPEERNHYSAIVSAVLPFIKRAAQTMERHGKKRTPEQQSVVIENFMVAMRYYSQLTDMQGITSLDLTRPVTL